MSQFGTISRQISRHNPSNSSVSMVSATGTYRRAPSVTSQSSIHQQHQQQQQQPHVNGGAPVYGQNSSKVLLPTLNILRLDQAHLCRRSVLKVEINAPLGETAPPRGRYEPRQSRD